MSGFKRKTEGNQEGIAEVIEANDPLHRKNFMCSKSLDARLKFLVFTSGGKTSESELIRKALEKVYT